MRISKSVALNNHCPVGSVWWIEFLICNIFTQFPLVERRIIIEKFGFYSHVYTTVLPLSQAPMLRASFINVTNFGTSAKLSKGEVIIRSSFEIAGQAMYLEHGTWAGPLSYTKVSKPTT